MRHLLHKIGFHFWAKSGVLSRTCSYCGKKQYIDYYYGGDYIDADDL